MAQTKKKAEGKSNRQVEMPINGVEARALESAADILTGDRDMASHRRERVAAQLFRLNARWRLRDKVT
jgi:hypothetical protein